MACDLSLTSLLLNALDDFNRIKELQRLLDLALDRNLEEIDLLLDSYCTLAEPHLDGLERTLNQLQEILTGNKSE